MTQTLSPVKKTRSSNLEWLRVVCMLLIIAHHVGVHTVYPQLHGFNRVVQIVLASGGKLGVNVFVLISGYFLLRSRFRWRKVVRLVLTVWVYSVGIYLAVSLSTDSFEWARFAHAAFPLIFREYWFMTAYVLSYVLSPFLALLIKNCDQKKHTALLVLLFVLGSVLSLVPGVGLLSDAGWFLFLMALGAYMARYPFFARLKPWVCALVWLALGVVIVLVKGTLGYSMWGMTHPVCVAWSIALFLTFANAPVPNSKVVNRVASGTLGVYLIHDNNLIRPLLWNDWLNVGSYATKGIFVLYAVGIVLGVFVTCILVDWLRQFVFWGVGKGLSAAYRRIRRVETPLEPSDLPLG